MDSDFKSNKKENNFSENTRYHEGNSWQTELIISGGMMFTLWELPSILINIREQAMQIANFQISTEIIFVGLIMASRALLIGFGINLLLRTIWLALLGIKSCFPKGINYSQLGYSELFKVNLNKSSSTIQRVDKFDGFSKLSFSLTIIITSIVVGTLFFLAVLYSFIFNLIFSESLLQSPLFGILLLVIFTALAFGILDLIFFGWLKKYSLLQKIYYPISKFISYLNLNFIFRIEWKVLLSNIEKWKVLLLTVTYFTISFIITLNDLEAINFIRSSTFDKRSYINLIYDKTLQLNEYDEYLKKRDLIKNVSIQSETISGHFLHLFIVYLKDYDQILEQAISKEEIIIDWDEISDQEDFENNSSKLDSLLHRFIQVKIDTNQINNIDWYFRRHPITDQIGFHAKIGIYNISMGNHRLFVTINDLNNSQQNYLNKKIEFWKVNN